MNIKIIYNKILKLVPDKILLNIKFYRVYRKFINFKNPQYFGEKIQYLKLFGKLEEYSNYVDKYKVREYVSEKIGEKYLIPLLGVYNNASQIDYNKLPKKFVLKANHGSGYNYIVSDKNKINIKKVNKILNNWLKEDFYVYCRENQYKNVNKKIICEKYLANHKGDLVDYKFFCFNGQMKFFKIDFDRYNGHKANYYDTDKKLINVIEAEYSNYLDEVNFPDNLDEMIKIAEKLSNEFKFVRVDLYNVDGKIYFGELTFTPGAGLSCLNPIEKDLEFGQLIHI